MTAIVKVVKQVTSKTLHHHKVLLKMTAESISDIVALRAEMLNEEKEEDVQKLLRKGSA